MSKTETKHWITFKRLYDSSCIVITDTYRPYNIDHTDDDMNYYFEVTTGEITLPYFKSLNFNYTYAYFFTQNLENFFNIFYEFSYLKFDFTEILHIKTKEQLVDEHIKYYKDEELGRRSYEISYCPDIKSSIETSLRYPDEYYSHTDNNAINTAAIVGALSKESLTYKELFKKINFDEMEFKKILRSLIFFKVVEKRSEKYKLLF